MAPLLIDSRDLFKFGFITLLVTILAFAGGFFTGHQRAATFYQAGSVIQSLSLPEQVISVENNVDSQQPEIIEAGEEIDVDQPDAIMISTSGSTIAPPPVPVDSPENKGVSALQTSTVTSITNVEQQTKQNEDTLTTGVQPPKSQNTKTVNNANDNSRFVKEIVSPAEASIVSTFTLDELSKIKYSIQVGMYGRLINAENMMKMLQAQQYDAYVTDFTNKKNEMRYNVRFGYFSDKKTAIAALGEFKANQKGDGYLVRFSADNIVKIAGAADIKQAVDVPANSNKADKGLAPVIVPSGNTQDKISRVDNLNDMLVATRLTITN